MLSECQSFLTRTTSSVGSIFQTYNNASTRTSFSRRKSNRSDDIFYTQAEAETALCAVSIARFSAWMPHAYRAARSIPLNTYRASRSVWGFVRVVDWNMWAANTAIGRSSSSRAVSRLPTRLRDVPTKDVPMSIALLCCQLPRSKVHVYSSKQQRPSPQNAVLRKFNFLPNDDPYRQKTQPMSNKTSARVGMQHSAAVRRAVLEEIARREKRLSYFIYIYI